MINIGGPKGYSRPNRRVLAHISEKITQDKPRMVVMVKLGGQPWTFTLPSPGLRKTEHWTGYFSDGPEPVDMTNVQREFIFIETD